MSLSSCKPLKNSWDPNYISPPLLLSIAAPFLFFFFNGPHPWPPLSIKSSNIPSLLSVSQSLAVIIEAPHLCRGLFLYHLSSFLFPRNYSLHLPYLRIPWCFSALTVLHLDRSGSDVPPLLSLTALCWLLPVVPQFATSPACGLATKRRLNVMLDLAVIVFSFIWL